MQNHSCNLVEYNQDLMMALLNLDAIVARTENTQLREMVADIRCRILNLSGIHDDDVLMSDLVRLAKQMNCDDCKCYCASDLVAFLEEKFSNLAPRP